MATFDDVMEACVSVIFGYLSVRETVLAAQCSKEWRTHSRDEITARAEAWAKGTSRAWSWEDKSKPRLVQRRDISADDLPDEKMSLDSLDDVWRNQFDPPSHLLKTVAEWCGGWPRLLHARETSARPQPRLTRGERVEFTTLGDDPDEVPFALIFDIHCDGQSKWSGVVPINYLEIGGMATEGDDGEDVSITCVYPASSKTLGDVGDKATFFTMNNGCRPNRYLLSTDADDTRRWRFNVSIVSPKCFETLILSVDLVPRDMIEFISRLQEEWGEGHWEQNSGHDILEEWRNAFEQRLRDGHFEDIEYKDEFIASRRKEFDAFVPDEKLLRCSNLDPVTRLMPSREAAPIGIREDGTTKGFEKFNFSACYWLDKRNPRKDKMHLTLEFQCEDSLWSDMILNARKENDVCTACSQQQERSAKRRRTSSS